MSSTVLFACVIVFIVASAARAQTPAPNAPIRGYAEGVAHSAFGNVTTQSYGGEIGVTVAPNIQVFVDAGQIRNVATADIGANAEKIAGQLRVVQSAPVTFTVKQPVSFGTAGVRYLFPARTIAHPYVLAGMGIARVSNDVSFQFGGADASATLPQYVTLGGDLSGAFTKAMLTIGGGAAVPVWQRVWLDLQYRYGHIFAKPTGINSNRIGAGLGITF